MFVLFGLFGRPVAVLYCGSFTRSQARLRTVMQQENLNQKKAKFSEKFEPYLADIISKKGQNCNYLSAEKYEEIVEVLTKIEENGMATQKDDKNLYNRDLKLKKRYRLVNRNGSDYLQDLNGKDFMKNEEICDNDNLRERENIGMNVSCSKLQEFSENMPRRIFGK